MLEKIEGGSLAEVRKYSMQVIENKAEVKMAEVPHTPIATSAGAEPPLKEAGADEQATVQNIFRRIDFGWRGETCGDCIWFIEDDAGRGSISAPTGGCHRRSPVFRDGDGVMGRWPKVRKWHDVCGDGEVLADEE